MKGIQGLPGIADLPDLFAFEEASWDEIPAFRPIATRPQIPGLRGDPLEAAAMQGVDASLPERIVWNWLEREGHHYEASYNLLGGRLMIGGAVVDFIVYDMAATPVALRVMGDYWHGPGFPDRQERDDEQAGSLRRLGYQVVDLWEHDIYEAVVKNRLTEYIEGEVRD